MVSTASARRKTLDVNTENPLDRMSGGALVYGIETVDREFPVERPGGVDAPFGRHCW